MCQKKSCLCHLIYIPFVPPCTLLCQLVNRIPPYQVRKTARAVQKDQGDENPVSPVEEAFGENPSLRLTLF